MHRKHDGKIRIIMRTCILFPFTAVIFSKEEVDELVQKKKTINWNFSMPWNRTKDILIG